MGKGDKKSKKGKIAKGSYGNTRKRNAIKAKLKRNASKKASEAVNAETPAKPRRTVKKKAEG
ncbi:MAG TPA: 30S ribosomal protein THX [Chryseosolibacter sp.]|nr:30S ribosomal protein THX [Chryseosolibacter sp.]